MHSQTKTPALDACRDRARPLLVFGPGAADASLQDQLRTLRAHKTALHEREVTVFVIAEDGTLQQPSPVSSTEARAIRSRFHVPAGAFTVILLGKDGREKLRSRTPLSVETLSATVDAMPMRQDEMRARSRP